MLIIEHRINTLKQLSKIPPNHGIEIDLRAFGKDIVLHHDPFEKGELFTIWLNYWHGQFLVLNIKEEGIEERVVEILHRHGVKNYFFLDQSFPFLQKTIKLGDRKVAVRVSDIESVETALKVDSEWIWIDCFSGDWSFLPDVFKPLKTVNRKMCLVSPELVRTDVDLEILNLFEVIKFNDLKLDAVCTKSAGVWV
jgi:hypothetical protein